MKIPEAFKIVLDLAKQNQLDVGVCDEELKDEARRQQEAIENVEDYAYNEEIFK